MTMRLPRMAQIVNFRYWACLGLVACATEAVGVDSCRKIEYARCDAASHCPSTFGVVDPSACRRFYRDHCLHGLAVPDPGSGKLKQCTDAISQLGECAADANGQDADLATCEAFKSTSLDSSITTACGLLSQPEKISTCMFLSPPEDAGHH